jgi:hypothetical protein
MGAVPGRPMGFGQYSTPVINCYALVVVLCFPSEIFIQSIRKCVLLYRYGGPIAVEQ